jgi:HEAT repeat protein
MIRQAAMEVLAQLGGPQATDAVLTFLRSGFLQSCDPSACGGLALETLDALAQLGQGPLALQSLEDALANLGDALPFLYIFAEQQLVQVISAVGQIAPQVFDLLLANGSPFAQALGLEALAGIEGAASIQTLLRYVGPDVDAIVRRVALEGLARWPTLAEMPLLAQFVTDRDPRTRRAALSALARVGDIQALAPLRTALDSDIVSIRLDGAGASLAYANRMVQLNEMLNCDSSAQFPSDRATACFAD